MVRTCSHPLYAVSNATARHLSVSSYDWPSILVWWFLRTFEQNFKVNAVTLLLACSHCFLVLALETCYEWIFRTGLNVPSGWQSWTLFLVAKFFKKLREKSRHGTAEFPPSNMYRNKILILTHWSSLSDLSKVSNVWISLTLDIFRLNVNISVL